MKKKHDICQGLLEAPRSHFQSIMTENAKYGLKAILRRFHGILTNASEKSHTLQELDDVTTLIKAKGIEANVIEILLSFPA